MRFLLKCQDAAQASSSLEETCSIGVPQGGLSRQGLADRNHPTHNPSEFLSHSKLGSYPTPIPLGPYQADEICAPLVDQLHHTKGECSTKGFSAISSFIFFTVTESRESMQKLS